MSSSYCSSQSPMSNAKYNNGYTALMLAAVKGRTDVVKLLLVAGAEVDEYVIERAENKGQPEIVTLLRKALNDAIARAEAASAKAIHDSVMASIASAKAGNISTPEQALRLAYIFGLGLYNIKQNYYNAFFMLTIAIDRYGYNPNESFFSL